MSREKALEGLVNYLKEEKISREEAPRILDDLRCEALEIFVDTGLYVLKKNNVLQVFDQDKLKNSVANASDSSEQSMTSADLNLLIHEIKEWAEEHHRNVLSTLKIREIIEEELENQGFSKVAIAYENF